MTEEQIRYLRSQWLECRSEQNFGVYWVSPVDNDTRRISLVSAEPTDPENIGVADYAAFFKDGGYVDLSNCDPGDFYFMSPLFPKPMEDE